MTDRVDNLSVRLDQTRRPLVDFALYKTVQGNAKVGMSVYRTKTLVADSQNLEQLKIP